MKRFLSGFEIRRASVMLVVSASLIGCSTLQSLTAGKSEAPQAEQKTANNDITRPPTVVDRSSQAVVETSPDETISFEEWRAQREAERNKPD